MTSDPPTAGTRPVPMRRTVLRQWFRERIVDLATIDVGARRPLSGGIGSPLVEQVQIGVVRNGGAREIHFVLAKRAGEAEATALGLLEPVTDADALPELIDAGADEAGPWIVMPFYPGSPLYWDGRPPGSVYASLARLHVHYLHRGATLPAEIRRVDRAFIRDTLTGFAVDWILAGQRRAAHPIYDRALGLLERSASDERLYVGLEMFPHTLLHGDVYGLNVIADDDPRTPARLIDWGSARIGPAMLDVAMAVEFDSPEFAAYLRAYRAASGYPLDPWQAEAGHAWATAFCHAALCGVVAERFGADHAVEMVERADRAFHRFGELLTHRHTP